jgi:hypothetical protein
VATFDPRPCITPTTSISAGPVAASAAPPTTRPGRPKTGPRDRHRPVAASRARAPLAQMSKEADSENDLHESGDRHGSSNGHKC